MESKRQAKFSRLMQREMSEIFMVQGPKMFNKQFIGVSNIKVSPDLSYVKVYLSFIGEKDPKQLLNLIKLYSKDLRTILAEKIRHIVRKIPEIDYFYDDTMDYVEKMDKIFTEIKKAPSSENDRSGEYKE
jgi:ribosome-binding factor A